jgi:hypothetical protein
MKLKIITLIAAVMQLLALCCSIYSDVHLAQKLNWADNAQWFVTAPIYFAAQIMMVVFLFVLSAQQKSN